jgi:hypothetical protein
MKDASKLRESGFRLRAGRRNGLSAKFTDALLSLKGLHANYIFPCREGSRNTFYPYYEPAQQSLVSKWDLPKWDVVTKGTANCPICIDGVTVGC